eukprot:7387129-Prymnesium_polylepis.1
MRQGLGVEHNSYAVRRWWAVRMSDKSHGATVQGASQRLYTHRSNVCSEKLYYVGEGGLCEKCPSFTFTLGLMIVMVVAVVALLYPVHVLLQRPPARWKPASDKFKLFLQAIQDLGPAKLKAAVTFYQIILSLAGSFDLDPVHDDLYDMISIFKFFEFDWSEALYPVGCIRGGYTSRLVMVGVAPFALIILLPLILIGIVFFSNLLWTPVKIRHSLVRASSSMESSGFPRRGRTMSIAGNLMTLVVPGCGGDRKSSICEVPTLAAFCAVCGKEFDGEEKFCGKCNQVRPFQRPLPLAIASQKSSPRGVLGSARRMSTFVSRQQNFQASLEKMSAWQRRLLQMFPFVIFVVFVGLPTVSRTIFSVWDCVPYKSDADSSIYYLRRDLKVNCDSDDHKEMIIVAAVLVVIWPIGMPIFFFFALFKTRKELRKSRRT